MTLPVISENAEQELAAIQADIKSSLETSNPWVKWGWQRSIAKGLGRRVFAFYYTLRAMWTQFFPHTSSGAYAQQWASFKNISPVAASKASGNITATGIDASEILTGSIVKAGGKDYEVLADATIAESVISISSLTRSGIVATCVTAADHELASGMSVPISGATESQWNTTFYSIIVTAANAFTFASTPSFPASATGTPVVTISKATVSVRSVASGIEQNQDAGVAMTWDSSITGVDDTAFVQFGGIIGGADADDVEDPKGDYRRRINDMFANPITLNNEEHLKRIVMGIDRANTRVWVRRTWNNTTSLTEAGCMAVFFVRDGDEDILPNSSHEANAKAAIMATVTPNVHEDDVYVGKPGPIYFAVSITGVIPATASMRNALRAQVRSFFRNLNNEGESLSVDKFRGFLYQTFDVSAGQQIESFILNSPYIDQEVEYGQIAIPSSITVN